MTAIRWSPDVEQLEAGPAARIALTRPDWEASGAVFHARKDGDGDTVQLATGAIKTGVGEIPFGALAYDDDEETELLVPGLSDSLRQNTAAVLITLAASDVLRLPEDVLDVSESGPMSAYMPTAARLGAVEGMLARVLDYLIDDDPGAEHYIAPAMYEDEHHRPQEASFAGAWPPIGVHGYQKFEVWNLEHQPGIAGLHFSAPWRGDAVEINISDLAQRGIIRKPTAEALELAAKFRAVDTESPPVPFITGSKPQFRRGRRRGKRIR
jgi:hypothetical protein